MYYTALFFIFAYIGMAHPSPQCTPPHACVLTCTTHTAVGFNVVWKQAYKVPQSCHSVYCLNLCH